MADGQKASMGQVKSMVRRKLRRIPPHEEQSLNIYPMMDIMTIILVFMIMQVANDTANITQGDELQLPWTTSTESITEAVPIQISRTEIVVDGNNVVQLRNGIVDPSQKQGGANGFLITPLLNVMQQHRDRLKLIAQRNPRRPFTGEVQIIADRRTPFRTLSEIIYTMGQAEFAHMHFVAIEESQGAE
ncbi:MAG: biopolymer transporter ExbD [Myxococcota bacterium]|nr:biopolymer transporter ExbD [Myxococcota bacterium]